MNIVVLEIIGSGKIGVLLTNFKNQGFILYNGMVANSVLCIEDFRSKDPPYTCL